MTQTTMVASSGGAVAGETGFRVVATASGELLSSTSRFQQKTSASAPSTTSKMFLQPDILYRILSDFCDASALEAFMIATVTTKMKRSSKDDTIDDNHDKKDGRGSQGNKMIDDYCILVEDAYNERINKFNPDQHARKEADDDSDVHSKTKYWRVLSTCLTLFSGAPSQPNEDRTSLLSRKLLVLDFFETCPGMVWSGKLRFRDPMCVPLLCGNIGGGDDRGDDRYIDRDTVANVVLTMSPETWSIDHIHSWRVSISRGQSSSNADCRISPQLLSSNTSTATNTTPLSPSLYTLKMEHYNFIPIRPRGMLRGITSSRNDQEIIREIAMELDRCDRVATQSTVMRTTRGPRHEQHNDHVLILRIISYPQARRRLASLYGGMRRGRQHHHRDGEDGQNPDQMTISPALKDALQALDNDLMMHSITCLTPSSLAAAVVENGTLMSTSSLNKNIDVGFDPYSFLVCCWESERQWEHEGRLSVDEKVDAIHAAVNDFKHVHVAVG